MADRVDYEKLSIDDAFSGLSSSPGGLSTTEAARRLTRYGPNTISEKKTSSLVSFLGRLIQPINLIIEVAITLALVLKDWGDAALIFFLLSLNVAIDYVHERRAEGVLEGLKKMLAVRARVKRDGEWKTLGAQDLVPGDVVILHGGDIVPADVKLLDGTPLQLDEAAVTGESLPVTKGAGSIAFSSSKVNNGELQALVVQTGDRTFFGRAAALSEEKPAPGHFIRAVQGIGNLVITMAGVCIVAIVLDATLVRHLPASTVLLLALTLAVASIPAALRAVLTVVLTVGASHLAKESVLVRRLQATEELASADTICTDKTGTLTTGKLEMSDPIIYGEVEPREVLEMAVLCSSYPATEDPIDSAIGWGVTRRGMDPASLEWKPTKCEIADSLTKRSLSVVERDGQQRRIMRGAPQVVLAASSVGDDERAKFENDVERLAKTGYRAIGIAYQDAPFPEEEKGMKLVAVLPLRDPPRPESRETIAAARNMGITVKMLTGDHESAAREIASELGMDGRLATAGEIEGWSDQEFAEKAQSIEVFAQVLPENKYRIVDALQRTGHIVGMTGDGVNDSPALNKADVGIAVESATDVARSASDVVLTKAGLKVIIDGVREGKLVFGRMKSYAIYRISETLRIVLFVAVAILALGISPLQASQVVLLAIMNDIPILAVAGDRTTEEAGPETWAMPRLITLGVALGLTGILNSTLLLLLLRHRLPLPELQTAMFLALSVSGHMLFFTARQRHRWWSRPYPSRTLLAAVLTTMAFATTISILGLGSLLPGISPLIALFIWGWCFVWMQVTDGGAKLLTYELIDRRNRAVAGEARAAA